MNVIALLPLLVQNYECLTPSCRDAADHIAQVSKIILCLIKKPYWFDYAGDILF